MLNAKCCRYGILDSNFHLTLKIPDIFSNTLSWYEILKYYVRIELVKLIWKFIMYLSLKLKLHTMFTITKALIELRAILNKKCCLDWLTSYTQIGRRVMLQNWEKCETLVLHTYEKSLSLGVSRGQLIIMEECCRSLALTWIFIQMY